MPLTRLDNLISSKTGKYLYVSPDDFNATDSLSNRGNSPVTPFKSIQRAFLEIARYSYTPGPSNDRFDQFTVMLMPGIHYIDNRPGVEDTSEIEQFLFDQGTNAWGADPNLDISDPDNILYKFNNTEGGAIIPRGSSLVGYDLRRTTVRPLYVPDPASVTVPRSAIFNVTGGCYFWQFTIKDGQTTAESPLYDANKGGQVYFDPTDFTRLTAPNFSHHKLTVFEYADKEELQLFYRKIAKAFERYQPEINQPGEFDFNVQENRIVGPLSDSRVIESLKFVDATSDNTIPASTTQIEVTTKVDHGYFAGQFVAISNTEIDDEIEGFWDIYDIDENDPRKFTYRVPFVASGIGNGIFSEKIVNVDSSPALGQNAQVLAEVDSVESASPYVFNVSIRSVWGICGIWANGLKATGFKSMVIAQYTGVSLQRDDRAFIRYDEYANTWNQASLVDAFATVPYHAKGDSYWKDDWRNFHVRASEDAFIQNVSIFAVGFADHFLMESGGDMSITNSNSNFGNTSLHAIGFKGFSFNQDKAGYITDIIPPQQVKASETNTEKVLYYTIDVQGSREQLNGQENRTRLYLGGTDLDNPLNRPAATIGGYRIGGKTEDKLYVKLDSLNNISEYQATLEPTGFVKYIAKGSVLNPSGDDEFNLNSTNIDAANLIESNRRMIQEEVFGYIFEKYPRLQNIPYVNPGLNPAANRYFDARNLILDNRSQIVEEAYASMLIAYPNYDGNGGNTNGTKCRRDIGFIVDAIAEDLRDGGNRNIIDATKFYFVLDEDPNSPTFGQQIPLENGLVGEEEAALFAYRRARDLCKKAIANLLDVKADLWDTDPNSILQPYGINAGSNGSSQSLDADGNQIFDSKNVTVDSSNKEDPAGRYKDARNRIVANRQFILDAALAEVAVYHPDFYVVGELPETAESRYADAFRLVRRNSKEITDRALAKIAAERTDFYFPGDAQTNANSRLADAYRLIVKNKEEIADRALAQVAIQNPDFYFPGDSQTDSQSRFADAYRLIQNNRQVIIDDAWDIMQQSATPASDSTEFKCKRDIGHFIDAVSLDLFRGFNKYSRLFGAEYFDEGTGQYIADGINDPGEIAAAKVAFERARDTMKLAITNNLPGAVYEDTTVTGDPTPGQNPGGVGSPGSNLGNNDNPASCANVQSAIDTLTFTVTQILEFGLGELANFPLDNAVSGPGENKCLRDINYFIEAISLDMFMSGNEYSYRFAAEYFQDENTQVTAGLNGELLESRAIFQKARDMMMKAVSNQLYFKNLEVTADNAPGSDYGQIVRSFTPHNATYDGTTGNSVLTIANHDLKVGDHIQIATGGLSFTCTMDGNVQATAYPRASDPVAGKYIRIDAVTDNTITVNVGASDPGDVYPHTFVSAVNNCITFGANTDNHLNEYLCSDVQSTIDNLWSIVDGIFGNNNLSSLLRGPDDEVDWENIGPTPLNKGSYPAGATKCARDIGYFIDAISVDMFHKGNSHTVKFIEQYFDGAGVPITNGIVTPEKDEAILAFQEAMEYMAKAIRNELYYKDLGVTPGAPNYEVGSDNDVAVTAPNACSDVVSYMDNLVSYVIDAINDQNLNDLPVVNTGLYNNEFGTTGNAKCRRDIGHIVDAIAQDLWFGGNEYTIAATREYFANANTLLANGVDFEVGPSITAFKRAADLMNRAVNNQYYVREIAGLPALTLDQKGDPAVFSDIHADAYNLVLANKEFIAEEAYQRMLVTYNQYTPSEGNTKQDCLDDVYNVLEEVMWDVKYGGNIKTLRSANIYISNEFYPADFRLDFPTSPEVGNEQTGPTSGFYTEEGIKWAWDGTTWKVETFIDAERDEAKKVFQEVRDLAIAVMRNEPITPTNWSPTPAQEQFIDYTIVIDWDSDISNGETSLLPKCQSVAIAIYNLFGIIDDAIGTTSTGVGTVTAEASFPGATADPTYETATNITATTANTITFNVGASSELVYEHSFVTALANSITAGGDYDHRFVSVANDAVVDNNGATYTPGNAVYNTTTGKVTLYFGSQHGLTTSNTVRFVDNSFTFRCAMDNYATEHTYPRATDSNSGQQMIITAVTPKTVEVQVPASVNTSYTPTNATYNPETGDVVVTIGAHSITTGTSIRVQPNALTFTCARDGYKQRHSYPAAAAITQPKEYKLGNCSDVLQTIDTLTGIVCDALYAGDILNLPDLSTGEWDCANVRSSIETLFDIFMDAISAGSIDDLPPVNSGDFITNAEASKCFRDVSYIVDAVVNDLRYGGNINSIQAGEAYFVGAQLDYIDGEAVETTDAWNYVGQLATAAMRNFDFVAYNCEITSAPATAARVNVGDTRGIVIGMSVTEYQSSPTPYVNGLLQSNAEPTYNNIPENTFVKDIIDDQFIELGVRGSRLDFGKTQDATPAGATGTVDLHFKFETPAWADTLPETVVVGPESEDPDVIQDTTTSPAQRECAAVADAIEVLIQNITTIINTGLTYTDANGNEVPTIPRQEATFNTSLLASRATVFTIDKTGTGSPEAHNFETGTPVRLVPRPRFDPDRNEYVDVDKRLVRLPNGFDTNEVYYVIAPGRATQPVDYSGTTYFNGSDATKLMLASSKENAAAGIYIYASETESIDPDVEIDLYQFIIDDKYDLHNYQCTLTDTILGGIESDIAHIFDKPNSATTIQKVFFREVEGSELPSVASQFINDPDVAVTNSNDPNYGKINPYKEFFVRYQTSKVFTVHKTEAEARAQVSTYTEGGVNPIQFDIPVGGSRKPFRVFANKKLSPMRFDPSFSSADADGGKWYLNVKDKITGAQSGDTDIIQQEIFYRLHQGDFAGKQSTTDTWYERISDTREANERTYKLRYVIPKYLENARDPINGFVLKTRTDDTRKLVPQKLLLKPVSGNVYGARFINPQQPAEYIGFTQRDFDLDDNLKEEEAYDPFRRPLTGEAQDTNYTSIARFSSGIAASIQSGRYVEDPLDPEIKYLEITVFDHGVDTVNFSGLRNEIFTTVKISSPQGGAFITNKTQSLTSGPSANKVTFAGNSSGSAFIHGYYSVGGDHYLIIKGISGAKGTASLEYSEYYNTRFSQTQGDTTVFADMLEDQDMGKSLPLKTHIRKNFPEYYYKQNGANVYTITPGDTIQDDTGIEYYVDSVEDAGVIEDTFYIFDSAELQKRIPGQQDGIYYLTCLRGNISPFPQGAGAGGNFQKFKFSQPVGKLYPLNYRNDPLWFKSSGTSEAEKSYYSALIDPPQAFSAADNYIHGKVTVNDTKHSVTRELVTDLLHQPAFLNNSYTNTTSDFDGNVIDNRIQAQEGNATSGSEDRLIPIAGDSTVISDQRYYVELRRPSIARAGNHTFEYLGFGPGNYSTGLPARQEIVLEPEEDFYAQSKKQDAGIVFYTGINSQGDLYIGNRRINAITGEETFIDRAVLADDGDEDDVIGQLVTTFDTPVTFNKNITVVGDDNGKLVSRFLSPVEINVPDNQVVQQGTPLLIYSLVNATGANGQPQDQYLNFDQIDGIGEGGHIRIGQNTVSSAVFEYNRRGKGLGYKSLIHAPAGSAVSNGNVAPNQGFTISNGGTAINIMQYVVYGGVPQEETEGGQTIITTSGGVLPEPGDMLLKGDAVNKSGSLGWIYANIFTEIDNVNIDAIEIEQSGSTYIGTITFIDPANNPIKLDDFTPPITPTSTIKLENIVRYASFIGNWKIINNAEYQFNGQSNQLFIEIVPVNSQVSIPVGSYDWDTDIINFTASPSPNGRMFYAENKWKEYGVIGSEAMRTDSDTWGDFKLGINTLNRVDHEAYDTAWVQPKNTDPRANLEVIGTTFITGRKTTQDSWINNASFATRTVDKVSDAFVVGYSDDLLNNAQRSTVVAFIDAKQAVFRVSTLTTASSEVGRPSNYGKVGVNITNAELDRALVVQGDARFTEDVRFHRDIEVYNHPGVDGTETAEIRTGITTGTFNVIDDATFVGTLNFANYVTAATIVDNTNTLALANGAELITIGNTTTSSQDIYIGNANKVQSRFFLGDDVEGDQFFFLGNKSLHSNIYIGHTPDDNNSNISKVVIGGAYAQPSETLSTTTIDTKSFKIAGDIILGVGADVAGGPITRRGLTDSLTLTSTAGTVDFFGGNSVTNILNFATNVSNLTMAGQGGTTTIRNNLVVNATAEVNSNLVLCGGLDAFTFSAYRNRSGSSNMEHLSGELGDGLFNNNVDIITVARLTSGEAGYNEIDTVGSSNWGGIQYQNEITEIGGNPQVEPQELPELTGNQYYLPLLNAPLDANGASYFRENDILLIDSPEGVGESRVTLDTSIIDATDPTASFIDDYEGVLFDNSGAGVGSSGGFNTGQTYIHFVGVSSSGTRYATLDAVDGSFLSTGAISKMEFDVHVGTNSNGGEFPDVVTPASSSEALQLRYSLDDGNTWVTIGDIVPAGQTDLVVTPQFVQFMDPDTNRQFVKMEVNIPVAAQQAGVKFQLFQQANTGVDNYGVVGITYVTGSATTISTHVEFVKVVSTPRINVRPYYIVVERQPFGTFTGVRNDHPDRTSVYKCNVQFDATWTTQDIPFNEDAITDVYLSRIGSSLQLNDYIILGRESTPLAPDPTTYDVGEVLQIQQPLTQEKIKFRISSDCSGGDSNDVFVVDSTTGDVTIGDNTSTSLLNINGTLNLNGLCDRDFTYPSPDPALDNHLYISNKYGNTFDVNVCNGDTIIGTTQGAVFAHGGWWSSTPIDHTVEDSIVYGYRFSKFTLNIGGPISSVSVGFTVDDVNIPVDDISVFQKGDMIAVYDGADVNASRGEIMIITDDPYTSGGQGYLPTIYNADYPAAAYPNGGRAQEETVKLNFTSGGATVVKIYKYKVSSKLVENIPATNRTPANPSYLASLIQVKLSDSRLVGNKLDSPHFFRITTTDPITTNKTTEWFYPDSIDGQESAYSVRLSKATQSVQQALNVLDPDFMGEHPRDFYTATFGGGTTIIHDAVELHSGELRMYGCDGETLIFNVANDDDHPADGAILDAKTKKGGMYLKGHQFIHGDINVYEDNCEAWGNCSEELKFKVYGDTGSVDVGEQLYVRGKLIANDGDAFGDATTPIFHIDNIGNAGTGGIEGPRDFKIYQDGSIDTFGIQRYFTRNGGRRYTYVDQSATGIGQTQGSPLQPNNNYILNNPSGTNMVLYLPDYAETGDMIRFVECSGNLSYDSQLVIRALKVGGLSVAIQGDITGSTIKEGSGFNSVAWDSGELIVQTRNASFGLIYVGPTDAPGAEDERSIPSNLRGWWLTEL